MDDITLVLVMHGIAKSMKDALDRHPTANNVTVSYGALLDYAKSGFLRVNLIGSYERSVGENTIIRSEIINAIRKCERDIRALRESKVQELEREITLKESSLRRLDLEEEDMIREAIKAEQERIRRKKESTMAELRLIHAEKKEIIDSVGYPQSEKSQ